MTSKRRAGSNGIDEKGGAPPDQPSTCVGDCQQLSGVTIKRRQRRRAGWVVRTAIWGGIGGDLPRVGNGKIWVPAALENSFTEY